MLISHPHRCIVAGACLYFIYPYAELDGKTLTLESRFSFRDRASAATP